MNRYKKDSQRQNEFERPALPIEKIVDANTVVGHSIITASGAQVIPLTSITVVNICGGGEYGDIKTFKEAEGFKLAGGNGSVITLKPRGFLVDDGKNCRLLKMEEEPVNALIEKAGELVHNIADN